MVPSTLLLKLHQHQVSRYTLLSRVNWNYVVASPLAFASHDEGLMQKACNGTPKQCATMDTHVVELDRVLNFKRQRFAG